MDPCRSIASSVGRGFATRRSAGSARSRRGADPRRAERGCERRMRRHTRSMTTFDPEAPLAAAPDPWRETEAPSRRTGPPYHMTEMIAAEPFVAERILARLADPQGPAGRLAGAIGQAASSGASI